MEIDLPRMRSLSPHIDSPPPINTMPVMTQLNLTDITETEQNTLDTPLLNTTRACDWKYDSDTCGCKTVCGCKYINKVIQKENSSSSLEENHGFSFIFKREFDPKWNR